MSETPTSEEQQMAGAASKAAKAATDQEAVEGKKSRAAARSPREKAQEALDTANRKVARAEKRKAEAFATMRTIGAEIEALKAERDYLAAHPALQDGLRLVGGEADEAGLPEVIGESAEVDRDEAVMEAVGDGEVAGGGTIVADEPEPTEAVDLSETADA